MQLQAAKDLVIDAAGAALALNYLDHLITKTVLTDDVAAKDITLRSHPCQADAYRIATWGWLSSAEGIEFLRELDIAKRVHTWTEDAALPVDEVWAETPSCRVKLVRLSTTGLCINGSF